ncbi:hypothetical protein [Micromonospora sp. 067-2]|uniref:hypothetical protein n=1 Tax=Micromonospora sp. 067-2 TaxID=2789270 RepID=UPI00397E848A
MSGPAFADLYASITTDLSNQGYAVSDHCDTLLAERLAQQLGVVTGGWQTLTPKQEDAAHPWSLSGRYGLGRFPWHIDGAVASVPPKLLVMQCISASAVSEPTQLLDFMHESTLDAAQLLSKVVLRARDKTGWVRYLPAIIHSNGKPMLRWDPRTCEVVDPQWQRVANVIDDTPPTAEVAWLPGRVAFIDNRRNLHRRPPITTTAPRELVRLYVH